MLDTLGKFRLMQNQTDRAIEYYRKTLRHSPDYAEAHQLLGAALFELDKNPEAEALFRKAIAIKPDTQVYQNLGTFYYYYNRYSDAL